MIEAISMNTNYEVFYSTISTIASTFISIFIVIIIYFFENKSKYQSIVDEKNNTIARLIENIRLIMHDFMNKRQKLNRSKDIKDNEQIITKNLLDLTYKAPIEDLMNYYFSNYRYIDSLGTDTHLELTLKFMELDRTLQGRKFDQEILDRYKSIFKSRLAGAEILLGLLAISFGGIIMPLYMLDPNNLLESIQETTIIHTMYILIIVGLVNISLPLLSHFR